MGFTGLPRGLADFIQSLELSKFQLLMALLVFYIILGCFLDGISSVVLTMAVVQAGLGMGFGLFAAPLLVLIEPELAPVPTLWIGFITSCFGAGAERRGVVWSEVGVGMIGRIAGIGLGWRCWTVSATVRGFRWFSG